MDEIEWARWRGAVDQQISGLQQGEQSFRADLRRIEDKADAYHEETIKEIRYSNHQRASELQTLSNAIGVQKSRIDAFENQAAGAKGMAKMLPYLVAAGSGGILAAFFKGLGG